MALPSGATMRLRPPWRWNRMGMRTISVLPASEPQRHSLCRPLLALLAQLTGQAGEPLGPDPHLERVLPHVDPFHEQLDDPRLVGGRRRLRHRTMGFTACSAGVWPPIVTSLPSRDR